MFWDILAVLVLLAAFVFLLTNGLHDASSVVATIIACGAATPVQAIILAAATGLLGALLGGNAVADTVVNLINLPADRLLLIVLLAALLAAVGWNLVTWRVGLPSSSTHALVGGLIGALWAAAGPEHIAWGLAELFGPAHQISGVTKIVVSLLISPLLGFAAAVLLQKTTEFLLRNATFAANVWLKRCQWLIAGVLAFNHGSNDTQKILGLVSLVLIAGRWADQPQIPLWSQFAGGLVMFAGTLFGGWSIIKTLGRKIFPLRPIHSFNSLLSSGGALLAANFLGAPISTTHLVAGTVIGVGAADEYRLVNWEIGREMVLAWLITMPAAAAMAALIFMLLSRVAGF
ncbi:MAG: inorganic phosphate transporter [Negativicutes bacterium]|nr:inorganic phosphate transporter [Negativicutes bacterium]